MSLKSLNVKTDMTRSPLDRKELRRAELIDAAMTVFKRDGFTSAKIDDVAKQANTAKGTVYLYFKSKEELFEAALLDRMTPVVEMIENAAREFSGPASELLERQIRFGYENLVNGEMRHVLRMLIADGARFPNQVAFYHDKILKRVMAALVNTIEYGASRGEFKVTANLHVAQVVCGPLLLAAVWKLIFDDIEKMDLDMHFKTHFDIILRGLGATQDG